jgi:hypothetical protein
VLSGGGIDIKDTTRRFGIVLYIFGEYSLSDYHKVPGMQPGDLVRASLIMKGDIIHN